MRFVFGYQDFWNLYNKNPKDPRVLGVIRILETMSELGYGEFFTVPVMRLADKYSQQQYQVLKEKERLGIADGFDLEIIQKLEAEGMETNPREIDASASVSLEIREADYDLWVKLKDKITLNTGNLKKVEKERARTTDEELIWKNISKKLGQKIARYDR